MNYAQAHPELNKMQLLHVTHVVVFPLPPQVTQKFSIYQLHIFVLDL